MRFATYTFMLRVYDLHLSICELICFFTADCITSERRASYVIK